MKLGGCQVFINCEGERMREYKPFTSEDGKKGTCYLAGQPGTQKICIEYSRRLSYGPPDTQLTIDVHFNGDLDGGWTAPPPSPRQRTITGKIETARDELRYLYISRPELVDGETPSSVNAERLGEIWVRLGFVAEPEEVVGKVSGAPQKTGPVRVNERDKKPGSLHVGPSVLEAPTGDAPTGGSAGPVFFGKPLAAENLSFKFFCREENWLVAKEYMRPRRGMGGSKSAKDPEMLPLPKREPAEEALTGGAEAELSVAGFLPQPQSPTPPRCTDEDLATLERPRKIPRRSGCFASTSGSGMMSAGGNSLPPQVKLESDPVPKVEEEVGELKVNELKTEEMELDAQIFELEKKRANIRKKIAGKGARSFQPKVKVERAPTTVPMTPEVIDLTD